MAGPGRFCLDFPGPDGSRFISLQRGRFRSSLDPALQMKVRYYFMEGRRSPAAQEKVAVGPLTARRSTSMDISPPAESRETRTCIGSCRRTPGGGRAAPALRQDRKPYLPGARHNSLPEKTQQIARNESPARTTKLYDCAI